jgi:hypothetical protein
MPKKPLGLQDLPVSFLCNVAARMEPYQKRVLASALGVPPFRNKATPGDAEEAARNGDYRVMRWISKAPGGFASRHALMRAATAGEHLRTVEKLFRLTR